MDRRNDDLPHLRLARLRIGPCSLCILVLASASAQAHQPGDAPPAVNTPEYHKLRYDDDFSYLQHPANRSDPWDPIKFLPLNDQKDVYLSFGGESSLIGPANILDLHPTLELHLHDHLKLSADWDTFWRYSESDGLYDNGGNVLRTPSGSQARFVGHQPSLGLEWELGAHSTFIAAYSHFFAGDFIKQSGPGEDVDCVALWLIYRF